MASKFLNKQNFHQLFAKTQCNEEKTIKSRTKKTMNRNSAKTSDTENNFNKPSVAYTYRINI